MSRSLDVAGAPASSAGDAFHETWALLQAMTLLERNSPLAELTVEGVREAAETDNTALWDGVDCALYFRPENGAGTERVELVQLKYSVTGAAKSWTPSRFLKSTGKTGNNSVARRLADAFRAQCGQRRLDDVRKHIAVTLLSNQPISAKLTDLIRDGAANVLDERQYAELKAATGLSNRLLPVFCACLQLKGGADARADLRSDLTLAVWDLLQAPVSDMVNNLQMRVRERMLPEGTRKIDRAAVLSWFSIGEDRGLFPCEPRLETLRDTIGRSVVTELAEAVQRHGLVCLHGEGGCGKTTAARALEAQLPAGSKVIIYDCFGGGRYKDRSEPRHRPLEAFKQLSNELARATGIPLFFPYGIRDDMAAAFRAKLDRSADLFARSRPDALLTLLIDAADNAVHAAGLRAPSESCFVHDLVSFQDLPPNVRIVISSRRSRFDSLRLPDSVKIVPCSAFTLEETEAYLALHNLSGTSDEIEDFHKLTHGNPRVQSNAVETATTLEEAIAFLRPHGQSLDDLFAAAIRLARKRSGVEASLSLICAALSSVPTPAPLAYLSSVCGLTPSVFSDLVTDLAPNLRSSSAGVEIANEDFEDYCDRTGRIELASVTTELAGRLYADRLGSDYAAIHLFDVLLAAGQKAEMQACLEEENSTECIKDPIKRRQVDLARLRAALHVASQGGSSLNIARTILIGAESVRTSSKVEAVLKNNSDLSAAFVPDSIIPLVLNDPKERPHQGGLLLHLASEYIQQGQRFAARSALRAGDEWIQQHFHSGEEEKRWPLVDRDTLAQAYAVWKHDGWKGALSSIRRWTPITFQLLLLKRLLAEIAIRDGEIPIEDIVKSSSGAGLVFAVPVLLRAGKRPTSKVFAKALTALSNLSLADLSDARDHYRQTTRQDLLDDLVFLCEAAATYDGLAQRAAGLASKLVPDEHMTLTDIHLSNPYKLDLCLRVASLRARAAGGLAELDKVFPAPREPVEKDRTTDAWRAFNSTKSQHQTVCDLLPVYDILQSAWIALNPETLAAVVSAFSKLKSRSGRTFEFDAASHVLARRLLDLCAVRQCPVRETLSAVQPLFGTKPDFPDALGSWIRTLLHNQQAHLPVLEYLETCLDLVRATEALATEKAETLILAARLALPWHRSLAETLYKEALDIIEEVDLETLDVLHALCRMVEFDRSEPSRREGRAVRFAGLIHHAGRLLRNEDGFPQKRAVRALCQAAFPVAAAVVSQWTDEGFGSLDTDFAELLSCAAAAGKLRPHQVALLGWLIAPDRDLESAILRAASSSSEKDRTRLADVLAAALVAFESPGWVQTESRDREEHVAGLATKPASLVELDAIRHFRRAHVSELYPSQNETEGDTSGVSVKSVRPPGWQQVDPFDADAVIAGRKIQPVKGYADPTEYFSCLRARITPGRRSDHLAALAAAATKADYPLYEIRALKEALAEWTDTATRAWARSTLPEIIPQLSHWTLGHYWTDRDRALETLLDAAGCNPDTARDILVQIVEQNALDLGSRSLLMLLAAYVCLMDPEEAGEFSDWCIARTFERLPDSSAVKNRYHIDPALLPSDAETICGALVYRFLGDIDAHQRWRATHILRKAAQYGEEELQTQILGAALSTPGHYTFPDCPFHGLSADLHIAIAFARLAFDQPAYVAAHEPQLIALWEKRSPHFLIGHFISRALSQARSSGETISTPAQRLAEMAGTAGPVAPTPGGEKKMKLKLKRFEQYGERFHFDSMDTIPYWYNPSLDIFEGASSEAFLQAAEAHIVGKWGGHEESHHWDKEPRRRRFDSDYYDYSNRHGSHPRLERHSLYLEWHGMFAAVGELLKTYPLRPWTEEDSFGRFPDWLRSHDTTYAGAWLSDIRQPPPLDVRYWRQPEQAFHSWPDSAASFDPVAESMSETGWIVLAGHREIRTYKYGDEEASERVRVDSAFIASGTARSLLRSLANTPDERDVYLPKEYHQDRMEDLPDTFRLIDSHRRPMEHRGEGIDEHDPLRFNVSGVRVAPSSALVSTLSLQPSNDWNTRWISTARKAPVVLYDSWSSERSGSTDREIRRGEQAVASGDRLTIDPDSLAKAMEAIDRDLIAIISISRTVGDDYARTTQKSRKEKACAFPLLLCRDGSIKSVAGHLGTWKKDHLRAG